MALKKLKGELSNAKAGFWPQVGVLKDTLKIERTHVERFERGVVAELEKMYHLLAERRGTNETATRKLTENGNSLQ